MNGYTALDCRHVHFAKSSFLAGKEGDPGSRVSGRIASVFEALHDRMSFSEINGAYFDI